MFQQLFSTSYRLFKRTTDPLYRGLGLGMVLAICSTLVSNCFGDRWTYIEITALLWVLAAAGVRALEFNETKSESEIASMVPATPFNPYMSYR